MARLRREYRRVLRRRSPSGSRRGRLRRACALQTHEGVPLAIENERRFRERLERAPEIVAGHLDARLAERPEIEPDVDDLRFRLRSDVSTPDVLLGESVARSTSPLFDASISVFPTTVLSSPNSQTGICRLPRGRSPVDTCAFAFEPESRRATAGPYAPGTPTASKVLIPVTART